MYGAYVLHNQEMVHNPTPIKKEDAEQLPCTGCHKAIVKPQVSLAIKWQLGSKQGQSLGTLIQGKSVNQAQIQLGALY